MKQSDNISSIFVLSIILLFCTGCKKWIEVEPPITFTSAKEVYSDDTKSAAVLTNIYNRMSGASISLSFSLNLGLSGDELTLFEVPNQSNKIQIALYTNSLASTLLEDYWTIYPFLFITNSAVEGLNSSSALTPVVKQQLLGEAKFIRAFWYFYLVNLYGDIPLALTTDYKINGLLPRAPKVEVYKQIIEDLKEAQVLLSSDYLDATVLEATSERVRPTKWAATALLARVYLYTNDFAKAETEATRVIEQNSIFHLPALTDVFLANSSEAIWQLQSVRGGINTQEAMQFMLPLTGPNLGDWPAYLSNYILTSFEPGDKRFSEWTGNVKDNGVTYYYPFKYKVNTLNAPLTEYSMVLRLAEQYLIRAEARTQQNKIADAVADLNILRARARSLPTMAIPNPLPPLPETLSKDEVLDAVLKERKVELFTEWGHRWFDLKRTGKIDAVMSVVTPEKGGVWKTFKQWYPISQSQLELNPNLRQNEGY